MSVAPEAKYTEETILWVKKHTPKLMTFGMTRPASYRFLAGQFARLGFRDGAGFLWRAYSIVSAQYEDTLTFFVVLIEDGAMSEQLAHIKVGETILLDKTATGFLLPERFVDGKDLVMLSTGSGIAPFLSILQQPEVWQRFEHLVLVHSVSFANELIFNQQVQQFVEHPLISDFIHQFQFVAVTTRETTPDCLNDRIPALLKNHQLEEQINLYFNQQDTRFMICGNPAMVEDTFKTLLSQGFAMHRNKIPGQILMENGF